MSEALNFAQENWIAILSLTVALTGGIPGIISGINKLESRPRLIGYLHRIIPIKTTDTAGNTLSGLILHMGVGNKGTDPLVPLAFQLECKICGKWEKFDRSTIPEGFKIQTPSGECEYTNVDGNDIQKQKHSITRATPIYGFLSFVSNNINHEDLLKEYLSMNIRLRCIDLFGNRYSFVLNDDLNETPPTSPLPSQSGGGVKVNSKNGETML